MLETKNFNKRKIISPSLLTSSFHLFVFLPTYNTLCLLLREEENIYILVRSLIKKSHLKEPLEPLYQTEKKKNNISNHTTWLTVST